MKQEGIISTIKRIGVARRAIVNDLSRRHSEGDKTVTMNDRSRSGYEDNGAQNYIGGQGQIDCPVCKTGKLNYSRANYNGHVHAVCTTENCVRWME